MAKNYNKYYGKEDDFQQNVAIFLWSIPGLLWWHTPNGGTRNKREAVKFKRMGVLPGVSDVFIAEPKKGFHGLFIELKVEGGRLADSQKWFLQEAEKRNYKTAVAWGVDEFIDIVTDYLDL